MKQLIIVFLFFGIAITYFGCSENNPSAPDSNQATQPNTILAKKLIGDAYTDFTFTPPTFWNGTVEFDGVIYGITYTTLSVPRDYSKASPFIEEWVVYELTQPGNVFMKGMNHGVSNLANKPDPTSFVGNGKITEAYGLFEIWLGRNIHEQGLIYWLPDGSMPHHAEFIFRIN